MERGLLVRISSRSGVEHPLYAVAVDGAEQAIEVLKKAGIGDGDEFAIIAPLSAQVLAKLGLGPGQFKCLNPIGRDTRRRRDSSRFGARRLRPPPAPAHLEVRLRGLQGLRELVRRRMTACAIASGVIAIT
jgi:hypothetical protein